MKPRFSVVIPVYNRPAELAELLQSLCEQTFSDFEVIIVDDGSAQRSYEIVEGFSTKLRIQYFYKTNEGQGAARNYDFRRATSDYFVVFDSDTLIPPHYFETLDKWLTHTPLDLFGGNDSAHPTFSDLQRAISYAMTSVFTTGGIRGRSKNAGGNFEPRSFNMGMTRELFYKTGGYATGGFTKGRLGEDIEFSTRVLNTNFKVGFVPNTYVYHKRRGNLSEFFKQVYNFGRVRWGLTRDYPETNWIKVVHWLPSIFVAGIALTFLAVLIGHPVAVLGMATYTIWAFLIGIFSSIEQKSLRVGLLSIAAAFVQLSGYGLGFWKEFLVTMKYRLQVFFRQSA